MSKDKLIVIWVVVWVFALMIGLFSYLWSKSKPTNTNAPKEFNVWVVWDETAWFSNIITWFKAKYKEYSPTEIKFTKFTSYSDYEKTLINVMSDGNSPDIFVINNSTMTDEGNWLLESKIVWLPWDIVNTDYFQKNFNKVFDELIIQSAEKNQDWKDVLVDYLKWIPMWYETLWVFYNFKKIRNLWATWSDLDDEIEKSAQDDYSTIWLWLWWKYVQWASDILSLFFIQNWISSYDKLNSDNSSSYIKAYRSYYNDANNWLDKQKEELDKLNLTFTDLFVRWKIGAIIWYPSLIKEIILSIKRTEWEADVWEKTLRTAKIFQKWKSNDNWKNDEKSNLINYNFFALSKYSQNQDMWFKFLSYLSTKDAQEKYISNFKYYLPAMVSMEESRMDEPLEKWYDRAKFKDFISNDVNLKTFKKWIRSEYDNYFNSELSNTLLDSNEMAQKWYKILECNVNHILKWVDYDKQCD